MDPYVLDFYCPAAKLAIEVDGGGHSYQIRRIRDKVRADFLARHGIKLLRFGIIKSAKSLTVFYKQSGALSRSVTRRIPHPPPLPNPLLCPHWRWRVRLSHRGESEGRGEPTFMRRRSIRRDA